MLRQAKLTRRGLEPPSHAEQAKAIHEIAELLESAAGEGRRIGEAYTTSRAISMPSLGWLKDLAGRAKEIVAGVVEQLRDKASEILDAIFGNGEVDDPDAALEEAEAQLEDYIGDYAEMVSETEIHAAVEEAVQEAYKASPEFNGVYWVGEPDACDVCRDNAEASPLPVGTAFPSGATVPPQHPRCRCMTLPASLS